MSPRVAQQGRGAAPLLAWLSVVLLSGGAALAQDVLEPDPGALRPQPALQPTWEGMLFAQLEEGDRRLLPRFERLPDGRIRVQYIRRPGEPLQTIPALQALLRNPPRWEEEKGAIRALLNRLRDLGVRLEIAQPRKPQAAGEWEPRLGVVRIRPDIPLRGSQEFARVLNHEAIHVAQSCRTGGLRRSPVPLGLQRPLSSIDQELLSRPIYADLPPQVQRLEEEAFGLQRDYNAGQKLLARLCRSAGRLGS